MPLHKEDKCFPKCYFLQFLLKRLDSGTAAYVAVLIKYISFVRCSQVKRKFTPSR